MQRSDYYIFGLGTLNVLFVVKFSALVVFSTISSVLDQADLNAYAVLIGFLGGVALLFNNLSQLVQLIGRAEDEVIYPTLRQVGVKTVCVLAIYLVVIFFDTFITYNLYGGY